MSPLGQTGPLAEGLVTDVHTARTCRTTGHLSGAGPSPASQWELFIPRPWPPSPGWEELAFLRVSCGSSQAQGLDPAAGEAGEQSGWLHNLRWQMDLLRVPVFPSLLGSGSTSLSLSAPIC